MPLVHVRVLDCSTWSIKEFNGELGVADEFRRQNGGDLYAVSKGYLGNGKGLHLCTKATFDELSQALVYNAGDSAT